MEGQLLWVLILQLMVIVLVAVSIMIFMLKKLMGRQHVPKASKTILITAADTPIGGQIAKHFASMGFRVFAGVADVSSKVADRLRASGSPWLHVIALDVTDDESLNVTINAVKQHFHAGEKGLWAVVHLAGTGVKQITSANNITVGGNDEQQLRRALEVTVVGMLRLIRSALPLLSAAKGRFIILGADDGISLGLRFWGNGALGVTHGVWTAARFAAEGLAAGIRAQLRPHGVPVISLHPDSYYAQRLNDMPTKSWTGSDASVTAALGFTILTPYAMQSVEEAVLSQIPEDSYLLTPSTSSRIKSMLMSLSPVCVTNAIFKPNKWHTINQTTRV